MNRYAWLLFAVLAPELSAQTITGSILGTVMDSSKAFVAGAEVTLIQISTGSERRAKALQNGEFVFNSLQPGTYNLEVRAQGFNHTQFSAVDTTARFDAQGNQINARFGSFTAARRPRTMQLALRFYF